MQKTAMNIVILGGSGHAKVIIDSIEKTEKFNLLGIIDSKLQRGARVLDYEVLGTDTDLPILIETNGIQGVVIAIGDNWLRSKVVTQIRTQSPQIEFPNVVHPSAQLAKSVRMGKGNVIMAGVSINSCSVIGDFCILNTNCSIDHDNHLGNFASFAPNSCSGGNVEIGEFTSICLGANIIHRVRIGPHTVVGAGATVLNDLPAEVLAYGTPAKVVRNRPRGANYL